MLPLLFLLPFLARVALCQIPTEFSSTFDKTSGIQLVVSVGGTEIENGQLVPLSETKKLPTFALGPSSPVNTSSKYIIVAVDPDAPSRSNPILAQFLHYMNTDFSPVSATNRNITSSNDRPTVKYIAPSPPIGTGAHRYVWLLYQQPDGFQAKNIPTADRVGFNVTKWAEENGLKPAISGSYWVSEFGDGKLGVGDLTEVPIVSNPSGGRDSGSGTPTLLPRSSSTRYGNSTATLIRSGNYTRTVTRSRGAVTTATPLITDAPIASEDTGPTMTMTEIVTLPFESGTSASNSIRNGTAVSRAPGSDAVGRFEGRAWWLLMAVLGAHFVVH
ncbi:phosphatidylethanolamine-binding protein [Pyronema omphalodes]|nr:phosphatidylethanolamine-binding protein [Pyronema omphalodes]